MISNERPSPYGRPGGSPRDYYPSRIFQTRTPVIETTHQEVEIQVERKFIRIALKENPRGRFLRITENGDGKHRNSIIIPATGLDNFKKMIDELAKAAASLPTPDADAVGNR